MKFSYEFEAEPNGVYTRNISKMTYNHRGSPAPAVDFVYDNLDRLAGVAYGMDTTYEVFTMDDLGNRTGGQYLRSGTETYDVNNLTNRYASIDSNGLEYDKAGNMTKDKNGNQYYYDEENRIIFITRNQVPVAEYYYDA
ncbi:MAG: hypothetical protein E4H16_01500, partial [Candidatus Atribacteria bacterium]